MTREIHLEERPVSFKQVVGQPNACRQLIGLAKGEGGMPHCLLFTGPSGCGKTTLARIVKDKLKCSKADFKEINAAESRGIEMVRNIAGRVGLAPIGGACRVWLIDECHQLTADAQGAFLKLLEEPPKHVYFMLATTDPQKLRAAIKTRCTEIKVCAIAVNDIKQLVNRIHEERCGTPMADKVADRLADVADGSARKALVLLQQIISIDSDDKRLQALVNADAKQQGIEIARALMARKPWATVAGILRNCDEEPESIRWMVLSYFSKVALGGGKNAAGAIAIMEEFQDNYYDTKKAGLIMSCYRASNA